MLGVFEKQISLKVAAQNDQSVIHRSDETTTANDSVRLAEYCRGTLNLAEAKISEEYGYAHLPLCLIDAIFSIGVNYSSTSNTVNRFCSFVGIKPLASVQSQDDLPFTTSDLIALYRTHSIEYVTSAIYQNRQRTSSRNGILKSEAVLRAAEVLSQFGVNNFPQFEAIAGDSQFEEAYRSVPGQGSGISLRYLYMLAGSEDHIKPDRMIVRFISKALVRPVTTDECHQLLTDTCSMLASEFPSLNPRTLDNYIWQFQRTQGAN